MAKAFCYWVDTVNEYAGRIVSMLFVPMAIITAFEVVSRYFLHKPTIWAWDVLVQLAPIIAVVGAGYTLIHDGHVRLDIIWLRFSPRTRSIIDLVTSLFLFFGLGVLLWISVGEAVHSIATNENMGTIWNPPLYPIRAIFAFGVALLVLQGIAKFIRDFDSARSGVGGAS